MSLPKIVRYNTRIFYLAINVIRVILFKEVMILLSSVGVGVCVNL